METWLKIKIKVPSFSNVKRNDKQIKAKHNKSMYPMWTPPPPHTKKRKERWKKKQELLCALCQMIITFYLNDPMKKIWLAEQDHDVDIIIENQTKTHTHKTKPKKKKAGTEVNSLWKCPSWRWWTVYWWLSLVTMCHTVSVNIPIAPTFSYLSHIDCIIPRSSMHKNAIFFTTVYLNMLLWIPLNLTQISAEP